MIDRALVLELESVGGCEYVVIDVGLVMVLFCVFYGLRGILITSHLLLR